MVNETFYGHDDDVLISKISFEYFQKLIEFKKAHKELWGKWSVGKANK